MGNKRLPQKIREVAPEEFDKIYKRLVRQKVRRKYDPEDEIAILRQKDTKPAEFAEYNAYVEECKAAVKAELGVEE